MLVIFDLGKNQTIAMSQHQINFASGPPPALGNEPIALEP
jgi:hypothetical protein